MLATPAGLVRDDEHWRCGRTRLVHPDEGHGFGKPDNAVDFWQTVEAFLDRELAPR